MIDDQYPDAVVVDVMMPGLDGFDFVHLLRHRGDSLPVLFLRHATPWTTAYAGCGWAPTTT